MTNTNEIKIIEIHGQKFEVDLRYAKKIEQFKVGDNIKLLLKTYSDSFKSHPAVIVGFDQFEKCPTLIICYVDISYNTAEVKFTYYNAQTPDMEICHMNEHEKFMDQDKAVGFIDRAIDLKEIELIELKRKKSYFLEHYNAHFVPTEESK